MLTPRAQTMRVLSLELWATVEATGMVGSGTAQATAPARAAEEVEKMVVAAACTVEEQDGGDEAMHAATLAVTALVLAARTERGGEARGGADFGGWAWA